MTVHVREVPEQRVLTLTRVVRVGEIDDHIDRALHTLDALAASIGPVFVRYQGQVSREEANPVEVCLPVADWPAEVPAPVQARVEPAHAEAYVTITKAETDYPEIIEVYATLDAWVAQHPEHQVCDAPREVYFADFSAARWDDLVCDVAYPITSAPELTDPA